MNGTCIIVLMITILPILLQGKLILEGPTDAVYKNNVNQTATLTCKLDFSSSSIPVFWLCDKIPGAIYPNPSLESKYSVSPFANVTGDYSLTVKKLNRNDSCTYSCNVFGTGEVASATVTVADPPGKPKITAPNGDLVENQTAVFRCSSDGGFPVPQFRWSRNGVVLDVSSQPRTSDDITESMIQMQLTEQDHGGNLTCKAYNLIDNATETYTLDVKYSPRVQLERDGGDVYVLKNSSFSLRCDVRSNPNAYSLTWRRGSTDLINSVNRYTETKGITKDTKYSCTAGNTIGTSDASINMIVHYAPAVTIAQGAALDKTEGERIVLRCDADAVPTPSFKWMKGESFLTSNQELVITSASRQDSGDYTCVASNKPLNGQEQSGSKTIVLNIKYAPGKPTILDHSTSQGGINIAGTSLNLSCHNNDNEIGYPLPVYTWYKSDAKIEGQSLKVLQMAALTLETSGNYKCQVSNVVGGQLSDPFSLTVQDIPQLVGDLHSTINLTRNDQSLSCTYKGLPRPSLTWSHNGQVLRSGDEFTIVEKEESNGLYKVVTSILSFKGAAREFASMADFGCYICDASSEIGSAETASNYTVKVLAEPQFHGIGKSAADVGTSVRLSCDIWSFPPAQSIKILSNSIELVSGPDITLDEVQYNVDSLEYYQKRTLDIRSVKAAHYGTYICRASNALGTKDYPIALTKTSAPESPSTLVATAVGWEYIELSWLPGFDGGKAQEYYPYLDGVETTSVTDPSYKFTGLKPNTEYNIYILSKNTLGLSQRSEVITVKTSELDLPIPEISYDQESNQITVSLANSTGLCVTIEGSDSSGSFQALFDGKCHTVDGKLILTVLNKKYSQIRAAICVVRRTDVCSQPLNVFQKQVEKENVKWIVIGVVLGVLAIILVLVLAAVIIAMKRRKNSAKAKELVKPSSPQPESGYINHVMNSEGDLVSPYGHFTPNNNLNGGEFDDPLRNGLCSQEDLKQDLSQNYEYVYASVNKKPLSVEKKISNYSPQPSPTASNSDNTEDDALNEMPCELSNSLGEIQVPPHYRFTSLSESGYSTPSDSKAKKVIYEVIV